MALFFAALARQEERGKVPEEDLHACGARVGDWL